MSMIFSTSSESSSSISTESSPIIEPSESDKTLSSFNNSISSESFVSFLISATLISGTSLCTFGGLPLFETFVYMATSAPQFGQTIGVLSKS